MSNESFNNIKLKLKDGNFPKNSDEILISDAIISNAKVKYKIGDIITLDIGERKTLDGYSLDITNPYNAKDETIENSKEYTFKIVGIIERPNYHFEPYSSPAYTVITTNMNIGAKDIYISLKNPSEYKTSIPNLLGGNDYNKIEQNKEQVKYDNYSINTELLRWEVFAFSDITVKMLYSVIGVVIFIIIFTSVFCIRNSFAISTTEKVKMYSMLSSIGATKKQIRKSVIIEAFILGIIGIPLGIISGYFAVFVLLKIVNALIGEYLLTYVEGMIFCITPMPAILSAVLGFVTIYLSAISSARKASKVNPIDGLRSSNEIKIKSTKLKVPALISKLFKTGGELAYKNLKRSKKKYRTTVISITVSIFIFITMNSFLENALNMKESYYTPRDYNIEISYSRLEEVSDEEVEKIVSLENVEDYNILYMSINSLKIRDLTKVVGIPKEDLPDDGYYDEENKEYIANGEKYSGITIIGLDDKDFEKYANKIGAKYEDIKSDGILCDNYVYFDYDSNNTKKVRVYNYSINDIITGEYDEKEMKVKLGKVTDIAPEGLENNYYDGGILVLNLNEWKEIDLYKYKITIQSNNPEETVKQIRNIDSSIYVANLEEIQKENNGMNLVIQIFLYGFITVITLIGVTNIFNTITSNMELRQKEFAMLKSIGMTKKEFNRMINLETIFYSTKSLIYGIILGLIGTYAMYKAFSIRLDAGIYIPIKAIIISIIFVFILVFIIMKYSINKINKQNTIDTIRNENI